MCLTINVYIVSGTDKQQKLISSTRSRPDDEKLTSTNICHSFDFNSQDLCHVCCPFFFFQNQHKLHLLHCLTERIWCSNPSNVRMNMSLPVSPCSSPLRQYRQSNRSCMPSPPHPAYSAGAANYSPINNALYPKRPSNHVPDPWLEISQLKAPPFDSPRRL